MCDWEKGEAAAAEGDFPSAIRILHEFLKTNSESAEGWAKLAYYFNEISNPDEAIRASRKAIDIDSTNVLAWAQLGWGHKKKQDCR